MQNLYCPYIRKLLFGRGGLKQLVVIEGFNMGPCVFWANIRGKKRGRLHLRGHETTLRALRGFQGLGLGV